MEVKKKAFSLLELMVAVTILSVGIVFVIRSFLSSSSALDSCNKRVKAVKFLDNKLADLEIEVLEKGDIKPLFSQEEISLAGRKMTFTSEISNLDAGTEKKYLSEVKYSLLWKEGNIVKSESIAAYLRNKETFQ